MSAKNENGNPKSARRKSREMAIQGIYEWLLNGSDVGVIVAHTRERQPTIKMDEEHFMALVEGIVKGQAALDEAITPHLDRPMKELSPIEHGVLLMGTYELQHCLDIPYRVVINEAVELAKSFGGTDGYKYVNGVLDKVAAQLRQIEINAQTYT
jgi:transcription antitermination protein NusB